MKLKINKNTIQNIILILLIFFIYFPLIFKNGVGPGDSLTDLLAGRNIQSPFEYFKLGFIGQNYERPVFLLFNSFIIFFFKQNTILYYILAIIIWIITIYLFSIFFKKIVSNNFAKFFIIIAFFPFICSSIFSNPVSMIGAYFFPFFCHFP